MSKYVIKQSTKSEEFWFVLKAKNGKTILQSEMYKSKQGAKIGIASVQHNASTEEIEDLSIEKTSEPEEGERVETPKKKSWWKSIL